MEFITIQFVSIIKSKNLQSDINRIGDYSFKINPFIGLFFILCFGFQGNNSTRHIPNNVYQFGTCRDHNLGIL